MERRLGLFSSTNIVIANMIGAGIFTTSGLLIREVGHPGLMILLWIAGGIIALCGALVYGELGAAIPAAGGEYAILSRLIHPCAGFLSGWVSLLVGFSAPIAASALTFAEYTARMFPGAGGARIFGVALAGYPTRQLLAVSVILLFTLIHAGGMRFSALVQNVLTVTKLGLIAGFLCVGFLFGEGDLHNFVPGGSILDGPGRSTSVGLALLWIMFAYSGWNAASYIGSEIRDPGKNIPLSMLVGTGTVLLLYVLLNILFVYATPPDVMNGVITIGGLTAGSLLGESFDTLISALIAFALFSSLSAYIILGPRVYYAMAKDGHLFRFAAEIHPTYGVPTRSILLQGGIASTMVMLGTYEEILTYMGFALGVFPVLAVIGLFKLRIKGASPYRLPGYPLAPALFLLASLYMLSMSFLARPLESAIATLTILSGVPFYLHFIRKRSLPKGGGS